METPRPAAACIIVNPRGEILMGRRNDALRFMGGHHVFPGGRVAETDAHHFVTNPERIEHPGALVAAVREAFEETGLLMVEGRLPGLSELREWRLRVLEEERAFPEFMERYALRINGADFHFAGHWITPEPSPIRFDTQYYLHHYRGEHAEELIEGELVGLDWLHPGEARKRWQQRHIELSMPVAYTLHHFAALPFPDVLDVLKRPHDRAPSLHNRFEMRRGIFTIPLDTDTIPPASQTNCILVGDEEVLVFDPGSGDPGELAHLKGQLDHLIELGSKVKAVVLTHSHRDHTGGVDFVRETYGVPVWAHAETDRQITHEVDRHLGEGEVLEVAGDPGWRLRVMHTPGHDPGHLCFFEETTRTLLCGDMIANPGTIVVSEAYGGHMGDFLDSLQRLIDLEEADLVIPAHGRPPENPREYIEAQRNHRLWREGKIRDAWDAGNRTVAALLATAYDDAPKEALPLAEHALKAHLTHLGLQAE